MAEFGDTGESGNRLEDREESSVIGPAAGDQACGETGPGRMLEPEEIASLAAKSFEATILSGSRLLVTAGPTREAIDPCALYQQSQFRANGLRGCHGGN